MLTFVLQCINPVLVGMAALLCLRVRVPQNAFHQAAWRITGIAFLWHALSDVAQNVFGGVAMYHGSGSRAWDAYMRADTVMNHGRTFLLYGLMVALVALAFYRSEPDRWFRRGAIAALVLGFVAGSVFGAWEGPFVEETHYTAVAIWDWVELVALMAALFSLLVTNRADRLLWAFLSAYGLALALGTFWYTVLAQSSMVGAWEPPVWAFHVERLLGDVVMVAIVARRLALQHQRRQVLGMLGRPVAKLSTLH